LLFASHATEGLQAAFDSVWESGVPYAVLLDADGRVLYKKFGSVNILELRRTIQANLRSGYIGFNKHWQAVLKKTEMPKSGGE